MKIAFDVSPLTSGHYLQHRVRGSGFYVENLKSALQKYFPDNDYIFFKRGDSLPADINIVHIPYFEPFFLTVPQRKVCKTVVTVHDLTPLVFPNEFPPGLKGKIKWMLQKRALKKANCIITDSESSKRDIMRLSGITADNIRVVYLAAGDMFQEIKRKDVIEQAKKKYHLPEKFALYVGDVTWNKNLPRLIQAVMRANVPLVLVGKTLLEKKYDKTNPWNRDLVETQSLTLNNKETSILGYVSSEDLVILYNSAVVFVMPSLYEGFGLPVLEAMQSGCPVVTSIEGSLKEVAGDAAYFVDPYNIEDIAKGMRTVFENPKLQKTLSEKGLKHAKSFSWKKTAEETNRIYTSVAKENI